MARWILLLLIPSMTVGLISELLFEPLGPWWSLSAGLSAVVVVALTDRKSEYAN